MQKLAGHTRHCHHVLRLLPPGHWLALGGLDLDISARRKRHVQPHAEIFSGAIGLHFIDTVIYGFDASL
jgi:hypothetical protein